jgi:hypothetical protein
MAVMIGNEVSAGETSLMYKAKYNKSGTAK